MIISKRPGWLLPIAVAACLWAGLPPAIAAVAIPAHVTRSIEASPSATSARAYYYYHGRKYAYRYRGLYFGHRYYRNGRFHYY